MRCLALQTGHQSESEREETSWTRKQTSPTRTPRRTGRTSVQYGVREPVLRTLPRRAKVKIFIPVPVAREVTGTGQHSLEAPASQPTGVGSPSGRTSRRQGKPVRTTGSSCACVSSGAYASSGSRPNQTRIGGTLLARARAALSRPSKALCPSDLTHLMSTHDSSARERFGGCHPQGNDCEGTPLHTVTFALALALNFERGERTRGGFWTDKVGGTVTDAIQHTGIKRD